MICTLCPCPLVCALPQPKGVSGLDLILEHLVLPRQSVEKASCNNGVVKLSCSIGVPFLRARSRHGSLTKVLNHELALAHDLGMAYIWHPIPLSLIDRRALTTCTLWQSRLSCARS